MNFLDGKRVSAFAMRFGFTQSVEMGSNGSNVADVPPHARKRCTSVCLVSSTLESAGMVNSGKFTVWEAR